jgi:hypothetical protein
VPGSINIFKSLARWLTPVILLIQEAGIRRIVVQSQPRQIVYETLSQKNPFTKKKKKKVAKV